MTKVKKTVLIIMIILNFVVLLGQIWPSGVPPYAVIVNITFLILSLLFFILTFMFERR